MTAMNILALNAGSSSLKASLFQLDQAGRAGELPRGLAWESEGPIQGNALETLLLPLWSGAGSILSGASAVSGVAHRVVHGGAELVESVRINDDVTIQIEKASEHAPSHNESALKLINEARHLFGDNTPQVAVFDTSFHRTLPPAAFTYAGPFDWITAGIRKFGFHGISHQYLAGRARQLIEKPTTNFRVVSCHLGSGCSLAAVRDGVSVDTTMGFTTLDGLPMATRSGAIDPGILIHLIRHGGHSADSLDHVLNHESGLAGLSGTSGDIREVMKAADDGVVCAQVALDVFVLRVRQGIAAMAASLGGIDVLAFTGGIGEHSARVRELICSGLEFLGVAIDGARNTAADTDDSEISRDHLAVRVLVVHAQENWMLAQECVRVVDGSFATASQTTTPRSSTQSR